MTENDIPNHNVPFDILRLDAFTIWCTICYATKLNLSGYDEWSEKINGALSHDNLDSGDTAPFINSSFLNRISDWHLHVFGPVTRVMYADNKSDFVKRVLLDVNGFPESFNLHTDLIVQASKEINTCLTLQSIGPKTMEEITEWFDTMILLNDEETLNNFSNELDSEIEKFQQHINFLEDQETDNNGYEYPFFQHKCLLVVLAHVVFMECYQPHYKGDKGKKKHSNNNYYFETKQWQLSWGAFFTKHFNPDQYQGLDTHTSLAFPFIEFLTPYTNTEYEIPPVHLIHSGLMNYFIELISNVTETRNYKITSRERRQYLILVHFQEEAIQANMFRHAAVKHNEKTRRCYWRTALCNGKIPKPMIPFGEFDCDIFLMGRDTYGETFAKKKINQKGRVEREIDRISEMFRAY